MRYRSAVLAAAADREQILVGARAHVIGHELEAAQQENQLADAVASERAAVYSGHAPEEVERQVTLPIEKELNGTPQLSRMRAVSIYGLSVVTLTFEDGTDNFFARSQVTERLRQVEVPDGVTPPSASGLVSATALTLFVLPVLYAIVEERRLRRSGRLLTVQRSA